MLRRAGQTGEERWLSPSRASERRIIRRAGAKLPVCENSGSFSPKCDMEIWASAQTVGWEGIIISIYHVDPSAAGLRTSFQACQGPVALCQ